MDTNELIARYFTHKLSPEAKKEFEHLMLTDPEFAKEVAFQKNIKAVITKEEHDTIKQQLQTFEAQIKPITFNYKKWLVAASIIGFIGISSFWLFNNSISSEKLYNENFEPYRNIVQPIVRGENKDDLKAKAFTAYETKNYKLALEYFNELLEKTPDETIAFYKANVLLELNETEDAITIFKNNLKTPDSLDAKNNWYLALAYLKNGNTRAAKQKLEALTNSNSTFKIKAVKQLLKKLN